jgi:putative ABC transport system permease protein
MFDFPDKGSEPGGPPAHPVLEDPAAVRAALASRPDTAALFGLTDATVSMAGLTGSADLVGLTGDSSFTHHQMVAGRWLSGAPGEAVLPTRALRAAGLAVGDEVALSSGSRSTTVTVVGEVFDLTHDGSRIYSSAATLRALHLNAAPQQFLVALRPGTDAQAFLDSLDRVVAPLGAEADVADDGASSVLVAMNAIAAALAGMLVLVAVIGVVNTVMLQVRERTRDIGVFKALGMTPLQTLILVITSVSAIGLAFGAIGVPLGIALHHRVVPVMGATAGAVLTPGQVAVYGVPVFLALMLAGLLIAVVGALGPASWAARSSSATTLRTE